MFSKKIYFVIVSSILSLTSIAQKDRTFYIEKISKICPDHVVFDYEEKDFLVEIEYECEGELIETALDKEGNFMYSESPYQLGNVLQTKIEKKVTKKYSNWVIDESSLVTTRDTSYIKIELLQDGLKENLYFTETGKYFKIKNIQMSEDWNLGNLSNNTYYQNAPYDFSNPTATWELPDILREISGMDILGDSVMYCIQDELGIVFQYDLLSSEVDKMYRFTDIGDFEDITIVGDDVVVLRSDGTLFSLNFKNFTGQINEYHPQFDCLNLEGLQYDKASSKVYAVCKDKPLNEEGNERNIYNFPLKNKERVSFYMSIKLDEINGFVSSKFSEIITKPITFNPSAIAIHPITNDMYVLSATNRMLAIYNDKKELVDAYLLPSEKFYKPEGLMFNDKGDLYISSEGIKNGSFSSEVCFFKKR